jgi:glycosyltransferase involved in cell wall biosynthesis
MKILHVINTLSAGGAELHLLTLCRHLQRQGAKIVVACLREQVKGSRTLRPDFEKAGVRVVNLFMESRLSVAGLGRLIRLLRQEKPDIIHTHLPRADFLGAVSRVLQPSLRWICSVHDIYQESWAGRWTLPLLDSVWRRADAVIAISGAVQEWLAAQRCIPADKIVVLRYGIEAEPFLQPQRDMRREWGLHENVVVGSIGRLEPRKAHERLLHAMPTILRQTPHAALLIAGHDPWGYGRHLQELIERLALQKQVRLVGFQGDIPSFLHALDVFAFASRSEGFGQVVIEAMAAGKPVAASNIAPLTEIVVDRKTGILVEPQNPEAFAQAISWLLAHPEEARRFGRQGQERVRRYFSAEKMSAETISLYQTLLHPQDKTAGSACPTWSAP